MNLAINSTDESKLALASLDFPSISVLGIRVAAVQIPEAISTLEGLISKGKAGHYFALCGMHGIMESYYNRQVKEALQQCTMVLPDGMPLVWLSRLHGKSNMKRRVYGPELMGEFCFQTGKKYRHFLYGGNDGVAEKLSSSLKEKFGTKVVGKITPPFRTLTDAELLEHVRIINASKPDVIWIGISTPKQDLLMYRLSKLVSAPIMLGVGAAFDFNSGLKEIAPRWIQENGLEWAYRLFSEPKRLWRRYIILGSQFVGLALFDFMKQKFLSKKK
jgi:N-acetylglucosaminyldiphosphoundecaprenol N-acetyl-beta-D-mannosaminyltransferase